MADIYTVYNECIGCAYNPDIHVTDVSIHFIVIVKSWNSYWISMSPLLIKHGDPLRLKPMHDKGWKNVFR